MIGFDRVFDTDFSADLTIMEEGTELLHRLKAKLVDGDESVKLPQFTSCSPGWVKYIEHFYPEYLDYLSTCKSPQQMFGAVIKTFYAKEAGVAPEDIVTVALMPCSAKKYECNRPEMNDSGYQDIDYGLTTREMAQMIREAGIYLPDLPKSGFDNPFGDASGAGLIFGATGGVMEAALRTVYELVTGRPVPFENLNITPCRGFEGVREASVKLENVKKEYDFLEGVDLKFMIAHGTANAKKVMEAFKRGEIDDYHFIEIMGCPGGCIGGGGQPIPTSPEIRKKRAEAIYREEEGLPVRKSHENPHIVYIYDKFLTEGPCSHLSHKLLHTHYVKRGKYIA
jgi:iron-only hydrogenase group A